MLKERPKQPPGWRRVDDRILDLLLKYGPNFSDEWEYKGLSGLQELEILKDYNIPSPLQVLDNKLSNNENCRIMILGCGYGYEAVWLFQEMESKYGNEFSKRKIKIDVYNLKKVKSKRVKRFKELQSEGIIEDHSQPENEIVPFEVWKAPELIDQFDIVISRAGVAWYTKSPSSAIIKASTLLKNGGIQYLELMPFINKEKQEEIAKRFWRMNMPEKEFEIISTDETLFPNWSIVKRIK